jgi:hypothetical protein
MHLLTSGGQVTSQSEVLKDIDNFCAVANNVPRVVYRLLLFASQVPRHRRGCPPLSRV